MAQGHTAEGPGTHSRGPGDTQLGPLCSLRDPGPFLPQGLCSAGPDPHLFPLTPPLTA